jgi:hypothetical protein
MYSTMYCTCTVQNPRKSPIVVLYGDIGGNITELELQGVSTTCTLRTCVITITDLVDHSVNSFVDQKRISATNQAGKTVVLVLSSAKTTVLSAWFVALSSG